MLNSRVALPAIAVPLIVLAASCVSPTRTDELAVAKARWAAADASSYVVESRIRCFCPGHLAVWTRLTVRDGAVQSVEALEPLPPGAVSSVSGWYTVPQLFEIVERRSDDRTVAGLTARYHATLGYPEQIDVRCRPEVIDCGVTYELRNLVR
jgi:hypothetical protein